MAEQIEHLTASVQSLANAVASLIERNNDLEKEVAALKAAPPAEPVDLAPVETAAQAIDTITAALQAAAPTPAA